MNDVDAIEEKRKSIQVEVDEDEGFFCVGSGRFQQNESILEGEFLDDSDDDGRKGKEHSLSK